MVDYSDSWTPAGNFGIVEDTDTTGGFRVVADAAERLSIPALRRKKGMRVAQADNNTVYVLNTNNQGTLSEADFIQESGTLTGDIISTANNVFSGINTFNSHYITGSITGSDARFTSITASSITANEYNVVTVNRTTLSQEGSTKFGDDSGDLHQFTGSVSINGDISAIDANFSSLTSSVKLYGPTVTINTFTPPLLSSDDLSLSMPSLSNVTGLFRSYPQVGTSTYAEGLGIAVNGKVLAYAYNNVSLPFSQTAGGLSINSANTYSTLQIGKPTNLAYSLAGAAVNLWSEGGTLGASGLANTAASTGDTSDNAIGPNYKFMYTDGVNDFYSSQFPTFSLSRARGNLNSPAVVNNGDILGSLFFQGRSTGGTATAENANDYRTGCFVAGIAEQQFGASYGAGIGFWTVPNGTTFRQISQAPSMWINNEGNVGIGLGAAGTAPFSPNQAQHKLEVNGSVLIKDEVIVEGPITADVKLSGTMSSPISVSNYALSDADRGKTLLFGSTSTQVVTCSSGLGPGFNCTFFQTNQGQLILAGAAGVQLINKNDTTGSAGQYSAISIVAIDANIFLVTGDTA